MTGLVLWIVKRPNRLQTALLIDKRLALKERFSTSLALEASEDPFVLAAKNEAEQVAKSIELRRHFLIRPSQSWLYAAGVWLIVVAIALFVKNKKAKAPKVFQLDKYGLRDEKYDWQKR